MLYADYVIDIRRTGLQSKIVTQPVEVRLTNLCRSEAPETAWIELVIARNDIHRGQRIQKIHRLDHLFTIPQLALQ